MTNYSKERSRQEWEASKGLKPLTVTLKTARELLGIGNTKLYELINDGAIETINVGRRRLARYASLERLAASPENSS